MNYYIPIRGKKSRQFYRQAVFFTGFLRFSSPLVAAGRRNPHILYSVRVFAGREMPLFGDFDEKGTFFHGGAKKRRKTVEKKRPICYNEIVGVWLFLPAAFVFYRRL